MKHFDYVKIDDKEGYGLIRCNDIIKIIFNRIGINKLKGVYSYIVSPDILKKFVIAYNLPEKIDAITAIDYISMWVELDQLVDYSPLHPQIDNIRHYMTTIIRPFINDMVNNCFK